ncbi:MAG: hypothetical protein ABJD11_01685 [Gemmatimonadota bacterium]
MEGSLFIIIVFGGGLLWKLSSTPIGQAIADRVRHGPADTPAPDPAVLEELDRLRHDVSELQERVDFAERMLAQKREAGQIGGGVP